MKDGTVRLIVSARGKDEMSTYLTENVWSSESARTLPGASCPVQTASFSSKAWISTLYVQDKDTNVQAVILACRVLCFAAFLIEDEYIGKMVHLGAVEDPYGALQ